MSCPCGFANSAAARFCGGCGKPLQAFPGAAPEAERRQVCVLFCDLVGSTPLAHRLDPEDLRTVVDSYQRACEAIVLRHGGFVAQYRGDGVEVYFGYPHAHEDDPSRAVRCALDMVQAVRQLGVATNLDLQVHVGIDCGRVVVGTLGGSGRPERLAVGETPNIAARVQAKAASGEVVISDSLWRLMPAAFAVESMGIHTLKGVERPLELFRVVASRGEAAGHHKLRTPFIGRIRERERVREVWTRASSGVPQFALLRGDAGIGKSRLIEVVREEIADNRTDVLVARCTPVAADTALHPIIELIGLRLGFEGASAEQRSARIATRVTELGLAPEEAVPLLASILSVSVDPAVWPAPDLSPVRSRQRTMDLVIEALHALARRGPVLFIIEDLHWADPSTLELLRQLIASPRNGRLMGLLTARAEFRPTWAVAANVTEIELGPFDPEEAEACIRKVTKDKPLPSEVIWQIRERAGGNPLFLEEIARLIMESSALVEREHSWEVVGTLSFEAIPASMAALLMTRIDNLGEARPLFQLAATIGREFSHDLLIAVAQTPEGIIRRQLDAMVQSGLVYQHGSTPPIYTFKHALVRDAAYDLLLRSTRQRYHARIAEVLIVHFPEVAQNRPELLAHHFSGAGFHEDAAAHWQAAGESAAKRSAVNEAVAHLRHALADLDKLPEDGVRIEREFSVLTALGPALMAVLGWAAPEVGETCKRAIDLARRLGMDHRIYPPLWGLWTNQFVGGRLHEAMETATQVLTMALTAGDPILEITGRHAASYTHFYRGEYEASISQAEAGLALFTYDMELGIAQTFQLSSSICSMTAKASSLWMQGRQNDGIACMDEMLSVVRSLRHPPSIAAALAFTMFFNFYDRNWRRLLAVADETYNLSQAEGFAMWATCAGMYRGRARIGLGHVEAGVAEVLEWSALFRQTGSGIIEGSVTSMVSEALHMADRSEEALAVSVEGERRAATGFVRVMMPEIYRTRGDILRHLVRLDAAEEAYSRAVSSARDQGAVSLELRALTSQLDLRISRGKSGKLPGELRRAMAAMACQASRPDLTTARALLADLATEPRVTRGNTCLQSSRQATH